MLQKIRDKSQGTLSKVFVIFVAGVFGLWGIQYLVGSFVNETVSITVNGVEISETRVQQATQTRTQQVLASMGPDADFSQIDDSLIRESAINSLIQEQLLFQQALNNGLAVSDAAIDRQIASIPDFQVDGVFNNQLAQSMLANAGYTPTTFRQALERETMINQLMMAYTDTGFITRSELEQIARISNQSRDLRFMLINYQDQAGEVTITDEEVQAYYDQHPQQFMREEQVILNYLVLDKRDIAENIEVTEAEIEARYQQEQETFQSEIERRASHILLEATTAAEIEEARTLASELKQRIEAGESFEDLAMEYSDDTGSAEVGGDVGYTQGNSFVEEFESALQALAVDEVSDPVVTDFGVHLIKLTEISSSEFESLDMARERIRQELQEEEADLLYTERAERLSNLSFESLDLNDPAQIMGLELQTTEPFGRSGGAGIASNQNVIDAAFGVEVLEDRLNSELIRLDDNRSVVIHLEEYRPQEVRPLAEVRPEIEVILRDQAVREMARETGERVISSLQNDQNLNTLLESQGLSWTEVSDVSRDNTDINPELMNRIFSMAKPGESGTTLEGFSLNTGQYAVVELQNVTPGTIDGFEEGEADNLASFVSEQKGNFDFNSMYTSLENKAEIER